MIKISPRTFLNECLQFPAHKMTFFCYTRHWPVANIPISYPMTLCDNINSRLANNSITFSSCGSKNTGLDTRCAETHSSTFLDQCSSKCTVTKSAITGMCRSKAYKKSNQILGLIMKCQSIGHAFASTRKISFYILMKSNDSDLVCIIRRKNYEEYS